MRGMHVWDFPPSLLLPSTGSYLRINKEDVWIKLKFQVIHNLNRCCHPDLNLSKILEFSIITNFIIFCSSIMFIYRVIELLYKHNFYDLNLMTTFCPNRNTTAINQNGICKANQASSTNNSSYYANYIFCFNGRD